MEGNDKFIPPTDAVEVSSDFVPPSDAIEIDSQKKSPTATSSSKSASQDQTSDGGANLLGRVAQGVGQQEKPLETSGVVSNSQKQADIAVSKEREIDDFGKAPSMNDLTNMVSKTATMPVANEQEMRDRGTNAAINLPKAPLMGDLNEITRSATGATEAGQYQVDGVSVRPDQLNKMLFDDKFVDKLQNGQTEVVVPKEDESLNLLIERQKNAGTRVGDAWNSLKAGATDLAAGLVGIESYAANLMRTIPGFEDMKKSPSEFVAEVGADKLKDMAVKERDKIRAYEGGFIDEVKNGNIGNAASMTANMFAESSAYMAAMAATGGAGILPSLGTLGALGASSEFAGSDKLNLTNREKIARATAYGVAESAFSTMPTLGVFSKNFNVAKGILRGAVTETLKQAGEGAAKQMAKELAKKTAAQGLKEIGIDMGKEVGGEMLTTLTQMGVDDYLGVEDYTAEDYKKQLLETAALTLSMGVGMTIPSQSKVLKRVIDGSIKEDKGITLKSAIADAIMKGTLDAAQGERLASAIQPRIDAINNLPPEVVNDVNMVDKVANISALELKLKEADGMSKPFIEAELNEAKKQIPIPLPNKYVDTAGQNTNDLKDGQLYISKDGKVNKWNAKKEQFSEAEKPIEKETPTETTSEKGVEEPSGNENYNLAQEVNKNIAEQHPEVSVLITPKGEDLSVTGLVVKEGERGKGTGSKVLETIKSESDRTGKKIVVTATDEFGGDVQRLNTFYEKNGFEKVGENKFEYNPKGKAGSIVGGDVELQKGEKKIYHHTQSDLSNIDSRLEGTWFTTNEYSPMGARARGKNIISKIINVDKLKLATDKEYFPLLKLSEKERAEKLIEQGFDGVKRKVDSDTHYLIFDLNKLQSLKETPKAGSVGVGGDVVKNEFTGNDVFYHGAKKLFDKFEKVTKAGQDKDATEQPIFLSEDKEFADANAIGKDATTMEVKVKNGKYFDFRKDVFNKDGSLTPLGEKIRDAVDSGEINLEGTRFSDYDGDKVLNNKLSTGDYDFIEKKAFIDWLKKEGYDGTFLREHPSQKATNLAVWNTDKLEINKPKAVEQSLKETPKAEQKEQPQPTKSVFQLHEETKGASKQDKVIEDYAKANPEKADRVQEIIDNFDAMKQRLTQLIDEKKITNLKIEC